MKDLRHLERLLKPLANKRRLAALQNIKRHGELSVSEVAAVLRISLQATSRHLQLLARADIIESDQRSLTVYYSLAKTQHPSVLALVESL